MGAGGCQNAGIRPRGAAASLFAWALGLAAALGCPSATNETASSASASSSSSASTSDAETTSSTSAAETTTTTTTGPSCDDGFVYVEPGCDDGDAGTVVSPAGCQPSCEQPGSACDEATVCLPASTRTCDCPSGDGCCPECRGSALVCLDRARFDCSRYANAADCEAAPTLGAYDDSGHTWYCSWETIVVVSDPLTCAFAEAYGECVYNPVWGGGCDPVWSCAADDPQQMALYRGDDELLRYTACNLPPLEGWTACDPSGDPPAICGCLCAPDFPG